MIVTFNQTKQNHSMTLKCIVKHLIGFPHFALQSRRFNEIYLVRFGFRMWEILIIKMISAVENSSKFQKNQVLEGKVSWEHGNTWRLTIQFKHDFLSYLAVQKIDTYICKTMFTCWVSLFCDNGFTTKSKYIVALMAIEEITWTWGAYFATTTYWIFIIWNPNPTIVEPQWQQHQPNYSATSTQKQTLKNCVMMATKVVLNSKP